MNSSQKKRSAYFQTLSQLEQHYYCLLEDVFSSVHPRKPEKGIKTLIQRAQKDYQASDKKKSYDAYLEGTLAGARMRTEKRIALMNKSSSEVCLLQSQKQPDKPIHQSHSMPFGVLAINKPLHLTSHDVVARLRKIFSMKKIGHLGTLDPLATGVLPVCVGKATRLIEYFKTDKRYQVEITLGKTTTTQDSEGDIITQTDCRPYQFSEEQVKKAMDQFCGQIEQQVPLYSAVHVKGKKLYELARQGIQNLDFELPVKQVTIHSIVLEHCVGLDTAHPVICFNVHCSSGTYIRSLARDIGEVLGCGAYVSKLHRTHHGDFTEAHCLTLAGLENRQTGPNDHQKNTGQPALMDPVSFLDLPPLTLVNQTAVTELNNGMKLPVSSFDATAMKAIKFNQAVVVLSDGNLVAVARRVGNQVKPLKNFAG
ncbi:MAG: tRNA pseudouridine(55) synthase TruB [Cyanobacteria bacterium P01_H01_bin.74]